MITIGGKKRGENPSEQLKLEKKRFEQKMSRRTKTVAEKIRDKAIREQNKEFGNSEDIQGRRSHLDY